MESKSESESKQVGHSETITVTFGDCAENHAGMQKLGVAAERGFDKEALLRAKVALEEKGAVCELVALHEYLPAEATAGDTGGAGGAGGALDAWLLVARGGLSALTSTADGADALLEELRALPWDTQAKMRGRVVNKRARHNLCFADAAQEPNYAEGRGRVVAYGTVDRLRALRAGIAKALGAAGEGLLGEGNRYYNPEKCYIGWHGDAERRKVVAVRLGASFPLAYHWHREGHPVGRMFRTTLHHGDLYIMSEKAAGTDWLRRSVYTLRHAAGEKGIATLRAVPGAGKKGVKRSSAADLCGNGSHRKRPKHA